LHRLQAEGRTTSDHLINRNRLQYLSIVLGIVILDQATKLLVVRGMYLGQIIKLFKGNLIWLVHVRNPGLAFGLTFIPPWLLMVIAFVAATGLGYYLYKHSALPFIQGLPLAIIMAGALGNLIDRIAVGEVVDFISIDTPDFLMTRFPVFNVADSAISIGAALLIIWSFLYHDREQQQADERVNPIDPEQVVLTDNLKEIEHEKNDE
jgi:signal peptidase II